MVEQTRVQTKQSLMAKADEMFANFDTHDTVIDEPEKHYMAKQAFQDDGNAMTMVKWRCDGLTVEDLQAWRTNPISVMTATNNRAEAWPLADDAGCKMWHIRMNMPMIMSNRSIVTCFYEDVSADGWTAVFHSS